MRIYTALWALNALSGHGVHETGAGLEVYVGVFVKSQAMSTLLGHFWMAGSLWGDKSTTPRQTKKTRLSADAAGMQGVTISKCGVACACIMAAPTAPSASTLLGFRLPIIFPEVVCRVGVFHCGSWLVLPNQILAPG